jgi:putative tryptophan/tyrosine transport system substrate-binding protein
MQRASPRTLVAGALLAAAAHAAVQAPAELPLVGFCSPGIPEASLVNYGHPIAQQLLANLRERGWHHEKNYRLIFRTAVGRAGGMAACIDSLVAEPVDVILAPGALRTASERAGRIPVVSGVSPEDASFRSSLPPSRRNFTGTTEFHDTGVSWAKQLGLFKELARLDRVVFLLARRPAPDIQPGLQPRPEKPEQDERVVGIQGDRWIVTAPEQIPSACAAIARLGRVGLYIGNNPIYVDWFSRTRQTTWIADFCTDPHRLPVMVSGAGGPGAMPGVLFGYGPLFGDHLRRWTYFVDRILKGAKAADLPLQQIEDYEVGVNLAVARKLGKEVPHSFLLQANRVYEDETGKADPRLKGRY